MLDTLLRAWRGRHVLVLGEPRRVQWTLAVLSALGASPAQIDPLSGAQALCRAMTRTRVSAVVVPHMQDLCAGDTDACEALARMRALLLEAREAGIPLVVLATDAPVYRAQERPAREEDALGGQTRKGFILSLLSLYADGVSRGLLGDPVRTVLVRHAPLLDGGGALVSQYARWCDAVLSGEVVPVEHPSAQGVFVHPADAACGMLLIGAACMEHAQGGAYNLGLAPSCLCANRTAARRLVARHGGVRPLCESEPAPYPAHQALDGSRALALCGAMCRVGADDALDMLMALTRARRGEEDAQRRAIQAQVERVLREYG